jgi:NAD+ diphosphatase
LAHRRDDVEWVSQAWADPSSRVLVLSDRGLIAVGPDGLPVLASPLEVAVPGDRILLGAADGTVYFAWFTEAGVQSREQTEGWLGLRDLAVVLDDLHVGLLTAAVALQAWHQRHTHCPNCGNTTELAHSGWTRWCPNDESSHFPRTDPAVIMLVLDDQDRALLGRNAAWPPGRMSVLAGFVEAGESAESAVAREVAEEVGIRVREVRYFASQPHPFPASLMLGFTARADGDPELNSDGEEIAEAGWFTRDEVRRAADWGDLLVDPTPAELELQPLHALPPVMSIARQMIEAWLAGHLAAPNSHG